MRVTEFRGEREGGRRVLWAEGRGKASLSRFYLSRGRRKEASHAGVWEDISEEGTAQQSKAGRRVVCLWRSRVSDLPVGSKDGSENFFYQTKHSFKLFATILSLEVDKAQFRSKAKKRGPPPLRPGP